MRKKSTPSLLVSSKAPSHRQQRVAEEIRYILSEALLRGEVLLEDFPHQPVTLTHVHITPDLRLATVWIMPLGGGQEKAILSALKEVTPALRHYLAKNIRLKFIPELRFKLDESFEEEAHINQLFNKIKEKTPQ